MSKEKSNLDPTLLCMSEAEKANKAKTVFLSNMSHEIRTPLNVIIGMCDIAQHHIDDKERVSECLKKISVAGDHLIELVNNVLDITKIEQGKSNIKVNKFNIDVLLDEIRTMVEPMALNKNMMLDISAKNVVNKNVTSDYCHLMQVLINLAVNSIKYTPQGGFVRIWVEEIKNPCPQMVTYSFICQDNGIGMSEEFLKRIFEPFVRAEDLRVNQVNGAGLGMSIVKKVVDILGGKIDIKSIEGVGTTVSIELDLQIAEDEQVKKDIDEFKQRQLKRLEERRIILIAEDLRDNREVLTAYLEDLGYEVDAAENGEEVVDMFMESPQGLYKAIIMDIEMPVMDGYQATIMLRGLNRSDRDVPIIAMTANAFKADRDEAKRVGMDDYLTKPLKMEELEHALGNLVKEIKFPR